MYRHLSQPVKCKHCTYIWQLSLMYKYIFWKSSAKFTKPALIWPSLVLKETRNKEVSPLHWHDWATVLSVITVKQLGHLSFHDGQLSRGQKLSRPGLHPHRGEGKYFRPEEGQNEHLNTCHHATLNCCVSNLKSNRSKRLLVRSSHSLFSSCLKLRHD